MHANPWFTLPSHGKTWITFRHISACRSFGYLTMVSCLGPYTTQKSGCRKDAAAVLPSTRNASYIEIAQNPKIQPKTHRRTTWRGGVFEANMEKVDTCWIPSRAHMPTKHQVLMLFNSWHDNDSFCLDDYMVVTSFKGWKVPVQIVAWQRCFPCKFLVMTGQLHFSQWLLVSYLPLQNRGHPWADHHLPLEQKPMEIHTISGFLFPGFL